MRRLMLRLAPRALEQAVAASLCIAARSGIRSTRRRIRFDVSTSRSLTMWPRKAVPLTPCTASCTVRPQRTGPSSLSNMTHKFPAASILATSSLPKSRLHRRYLSRLDRTALSCCASIAAGESSRRDGEGGVGGMDEKEEGSSCAVSTNCAATIRSCCRDTAACIAGSIAKKAKREVCDRTPRRIVSERVLPCVIRRTTHCEPDDGGE